MNWPGSVSISLTWPLVALMAGSWLVDVIPSHGRLRWPRGDTFVVLSFSENDLQKNQQSVSPVLV